MDVVDRLNLLQEQSGMNKKELTKVIGIGHNAFTAWNKGETKPGLKPLIKIAQYFNVSLDWLVFGDNAPDNDLKNVIKIDFDNSMEEKLIKKFRELPNYCKINLLSYLEGMLDALPDEKLSESVSINKQKEGKE